MENAFIGIGADADLVLAGLGKKLPGHSLWLSSGSNDPQGYEGEKLRFRMHPSVEAAASRLLPKIRKGTQEAGLLFLLSGITGKKQEDIICNLAEGFGDKTVVSVVWYPRQKHGQRGISSTLERLGKCSAVVALPLTDTAKLPELAETYVELIRVLYRLPYANAGADTGKRILTRAGLLHLIQREFQTDYLNLQAEGHPRSLNRIVYNQNLDTVMEYGRSALLHLTVSQGTDPAVIQYVCEYIFSHLGEEGELNFSISVRSEPGDTLGVKLLVTNAVTAEEVKSWL